MERAHAAGRGSVRGYCGGLWCRCLARRIRMKTIASVGVALAAVLCIGAAAVYASPCRDEAVQDRKDCRSDCRESFQVAKDGCLNRDHACVEVCRAQRSECHDATG